MAPETPEEHDAMEEQIENDLKDPSKDQAEILKRIDELQSSKVLGEGSNVNDWTELRKKADDRNAEIKDLEKARGMTSDTDFKKIEEDMKNGDGRTGAAKIVEMLGKIAAIADNTGKRPHNAVLQAQAYNDVITKIQTLDPENKIALVPGGLGGAEDDKMLESAKDEKAKTFKVGGKIATAVENFNRLGQAPQTKELSKQALIDAVKERKDELWTEMFIVTKNVPQVVDSQKIVQEYLNQIKELVTLQKDLISGVSSAPTVAPVDPSAPAATVPGAPAAAVSGAPAAAPAAAPSAAPAASPEDVKKVDAVKDAVIGGDKAKIEAALEEFNKLPTAAEKEAKVQAINVALANADHKKSHAALDATDSIRIIPGSPRGPDTASVAEIPKEGLALLFEYLEKFWRFLQGESVKNGDIGALKAELKTVTDQIDKLKLTPDLSTKPDIVKQIAELEVKKHELELEIERATKIGSKVVAKADDIITNSNNSGTPLFLRVQQDKDGNVYMIATPNAPGATPQLAQSHLQYMAARIQKVHPEVRVNQRAAVDQRVYFHIHGDVNINSKNRTDNSRIIDNRTNVNVTGKNNTTTVGVSADKSQNGSNRQDQFGALGAAQEGTAKNRIDRAPKVAGTTDIAPPAPAPAPAPTPRRGRIVPDSALPSTGDLS